MSGFSSQEISPVLRSIVSCPDIYQGANYILAPLMKVLRSSYGVVFIFDSYGTAIAGVDRMVFVGPSRAAEMYRKEHFRTDPIREHPEDVPVRLSDCLRSAPSSNRSLKLYLSRCLQGNGIGPCIGIRFCVPCSRGLKEIEVVFQRRRDDDDYSDHDLEMFGEVFPVLKLSIANMILVEELASIRSIPDTPYGISSLRCTGPKRSAISGGVNPSNRTWAKALPEAIHLDKLRVPEHCTLPEFTDREWQVIAALEEGHSNSSLSSALGISVRTVENHLRSIYLKAEVNSRTQLIAKIRLSDIQIPKMINSKFKDVPILH